MSRVFGSHLPLVLCLLGLAGAAFGQQSPPKKLPTIKRDTGVAEGKTDAEAAVKKEYSPALAEENLAVGKQYFKKGNYDAAISRFQDAIEYQPSLIDAYDALGRAFEKKGDKVRAAAVYRDFVKNNPKSPKVAEFNARSDRLEKEVAAKK
jgi:Tfp pilus assembly protein PilF